MKYPMRARVMRSTALPALRSGGLPVTESVLVDATMRCRVYTERSMVTISIDRVAWITTYRMNAPRGADLRAGDRVTLVSDLERSALLTTDTLRVLAPPVVYATHTEADLELIA